MEQQSVRVDKDTLGQARDVCEKNGIKLSWFVTRAVKEKVDKILQKDKEK